ncbi:MAG: serine hydrolase domain-containing protein [Candidatus Binatus sp.]|uniref:serine hydrolase domain-containing protein n=1 Tax=Candidatus Binatus sp. TaxID=2811406 RepID=UPI00272335E6|nr:serine hydrolase domain-containing protein [Candidatus Binatus sp.]MDO8432170.1 serine hydrolase domain-containing protein [Candidatus Binatus sp.]
MSNRSISLKSGAGVIEGECDPKFEDVLAAFVENFERRDEVGASVCINLEGRKVLDLWGGRVAAGGGAWTRDTISIVFSATKGASAICAHMVADRGQLDLDAPVTRYWPNFGKAGKEGALVSMMLDHSVGLPHLRTKIKDGGCYDYDYMVAMLENEEPFWKPGTRNGYHGITSAWTVGEMVHRASGKRLGRFFQDEVARPLGIDFWIGLPAEQEARVAPMIPAPITDEVRNSRISQAAVNEKDSPTHYFMFNMGRFDPNSREAHAAEIGSATGISNARGLAGLYAPLANGGTLAGVKLVGPDTLARMALTSVATHEDATLRIPTRFSLGFMKAMDNRRLDNAAHCSLLISAPAFGHVGAGGSIGFADPGCNMSFGYTMNRMGFGILMNDRGQSLIDAAYKCLGYRSNAGGVWA